MKNLSPDANNNTEATVPSTKELEKNKNRPKTGATVLK